MRLAIYRILNKKHPFEADNLHLHHLILKNKNFLKTFLIVQFLLTFPYILLHLSNSFLFSLFVNLFMYEIFHVIKEKGHKVTIIDTCDSNAAHKLSNIFNTEIVDLVISFGMANNPLLNVPYNLGKL